MSKNYFEELNIQGSNEVEMSIQELQEKLISNEITTDQFNRILMDNIGTSKFMELFNSLLISNYSRDILTKQIPEGLLHLCEEPNK